MHSSMDDGSCYILPGLKVKKLHSSRRDAFQPINTKPIALIDTTGKIKQITKNYTRKDKRTLEVSYFNENIKIAFLKAHPNMHHSEIPPKLDGIIIEGTGLGHLPINSNPNLFSEIKKLKIPVVMCTQTIFGRVNMNVYATGRTLQEYVISGSDMTPETAFIKLAWLLSNKKDPKLMLSNLKGEINERISNEFLQIY
ncbi:hypothetical protein K8R33_05070 [archaeon]|nr:hypothetical protein [archaeon]